MRLVTAKTIAAGTGRSVEEVNREVKVRWKAGEYDRRIFYRGVAMAALFALLIAILFSIANRYIGLPGFVMYIGFGALIFLGFRAAIYAALEPSVKASLGDNRRDRT